MTVTKRSTTGRQPLACVIGDISMVRALGISGIPVAVVLSEPHSAMTRSRYCRTVVRTPSWVSDPDGAVDALIEWGRRQPEKPVLFYQGDHDMMALSRARDRLEPHFRFVFPEQELIEDLSDKLRFSVLAEKCDLPVPETLMLHPGVDAAEMLRDWWHFPCVFKPAMRTNWYETIGCNQKALRIETREALEKLLPTMDVENVAYVVQQSVEGGEENIVSYHAYVRPGGETVAEFTGQKVRTGPRLYGISSCVEITSDAQVRDLGRSVVDKLDFSGVLKIDFKRDSRSGELYLLEINARFNLWHHPGAVAGVSIPEAVYRDCIEPGSAPIAAPARAGVRWVSPGIDLMAFKEYHADGDLPLGRWLYELFTAEVNEGFQLRDPVPGLLEFGSRIRRRVGKLMPGRGAVADCG